MSKKEGGGTGLSISGREGGGPMMAEKNPGGGPRKFGPPGGGGGGAKKLCRNAGGCSGIPIPPDVRGGGG